MLRVQLSLDLSPDEAERVISLVKTFQPSQSSPLSELPAKANGSAPASPSPRGKKSSAPQPESESEVGLDELKPLVLKAFALDRGAVESALKEVGVKKASEADAAGRKKLKAAMESILTAGTKSDEAPV